MSADYDLTEIFNGHMKFVGYAFVLIQIARKDPKHMNRVMFKNVHGKYIPATKEDIMEALDISASTFNRDNHVVTSLYINPCACMPAKGIDIEQFGMFQDVLENFMGAAEYKDMSEIWDGYDCSAAKVQMKKIGNMSKEEIYELDRQQIALRYGLILPETLIQEQEQTADYASMTQDEQLTAFISNVYDGVQPLSFKDYRHHVTRLEPETENIFYMVQPAKDGAEMHCADAVAENRYVSLDIDVKENGSSIPDERLEDLESIKNELMEIISRLPEPASIVRTRNGWQMLWKMNSAMADEEWKAAQDAVAAMVPGLADLNAVKKGGILRYPGSVHKKNGTAAYDVTLCHLSSNEYDYSDFIKQAEAVAEKNITADFVEAHPELFTKPEKTTRSSASKNKVHKTDIDTNDRIECVKRLMPLDIHRPAMRFDTAEEAKDYIKRQDIVEFLQLEPLATGSFNCIFHADSHPSAFVTTDGEYSALIPLL
ncbi:unnamed protein product, partial [Cylicocyclus nassatus]